MKFIPKRLFLSPESKMRTFEKPVLCGFLLSLALPVVANTTTTPATVTYNDDGTITISLTISGSDPVVIDTPDPVDPVPDPAPPTPGTPVPGACVAYGATLADAANAYSQQCSLPRVDCDPYNGGWVCSSETIDIGSLDPTDPATPGTPTTPVPYPGSLSIEAESASLSQGWVQESSINGASGNGYIRWVGGNFFGTPGNGVLKYGVNVPSPGVYQLQLTSRIGAGSNQTESNDVWVQFPTGANVANRQPVDGWRKVFMSQLNTWSTQSNVDNGHSSQGPYYVSLQAGQQEIWLSGRSNDYLIDKISLVAAEGTIPNPSPPTDGGAIGLVGPNDLVSLHFDNAGDRDDGHALTADRVLFDTYGFNVHAVNGAHGHNRRGNFQIPSEPLFAAVWPEGLNAYRDWNGSVAATAAKFSATISNGGRVWVADGGPMDFTADVLRAMPAAQRSSVSVVQHSAAWNAVETRTDNFNYLKSVANYIEINNGNSANATADLNMQSSTFVNKARASQWSNLWALAFNYLNPDQRLDFSDTVELLHILGIPKSEVSDPTSFANRYF